MKLKKQMILNFKVDMIPQPQQRSRSTRNGHHYTPKRTLDARKEIATVAMEYMEKHGIENPIEGIFEIYIYAMFPKPKNWFFKKAVIGHGDWDNHAKLVCDALNGIVWKDDRMITEATVRKFYSDNPGYDIMIFGSPIPEKPRKRRKL